MKKIIISVLIFLSAGIMLVTAGISSLVYFDFHLQQAKSEVRTVAELVKQDFEKPSSPNYPLLVDRAELDSLNNPVRVTLIARDGSVLYDNSADMDRMENHADRPEVIAALQSGYGDAERKSETTQKQTYYYCLKLDNGQILRVSRTLSNMSDLFYQTIPIIVAILILVGFFVLVISTYLSGKVLAPVNRLVDELDALGRGEISEVYEELAPFARKIRKLYKNNDEYIKILKKERDTIGDIIRNMQEGLVLLDPGKQILSLNDSAKRMLGGSSTPEAPRSIFELCRDPILLDGVEDALTEGSKVVDLEREEKFYRVFISRSSDSGVIIMVLDITDITKAEAIRRDFASNVSHELKTPITAIRGFAELLAAGMISTREDISKYSGNICREADRLIALIDDIMKLSQIEGGADGEVFEQVDLLCQAKSITESLELLAGDRGVSVRIEGERTVVWGNAQQLYELVFNLVDNAVKYNRPGGEVCIGITQEEDTAVIRVSDTGIGIAPEHHPRIFERFYRADKSRSRQTGGTGLGLSIVKHIVEHHGGEIKLESAEGQGTTVTVRLPKQQGIILN